MKFIFGIEMKTKKVFHLRKDIFLSATPSRNILWPVFLFTFDFISSFNTSRLAARCSTKHSRMYDLLAFF